MLEEKKNDIEREDPKFREEILSNITVSEEELIDINSRILSNIDVNTSNSSVNTNISCDEGITFKIVEKRVKMILERHGFL